jgi:membrane-associated phospholipid phosphatase
MTRRARGLIVAAAWLVALAAPASGEPFIGDLAPPRFTHDDLVFGILGVGATLAVGSNDLWLAQESRESSNAPGEHQLARLAQPLGNPAFVYSALAVAYGIGHVRHLPGVQAACVHTGVAVGIAGAEAVVLKEVVGRARPSESPNDASNFQPFSQHHSWPSGHATVAAALAAALDRETTTPLVPLLAYPAVGLVCWSRVHDDQHWVSDVVSGALLGAWTAWKVEDMYAAGAARRHVRSFDLRFGGTPRELRASLDFALK